MLSSHASSRRGVAGTTLFAVIITTACRTATPETGSVSAGSRAQAEPDSTPTSAGRTDASRHGYTGADVRFMQRMLHHHAQALAMTAFVPSRTGRDDLRLLAERIEISQRDEIAAMRRWLTARGEEPILSDQQRHHAAAGEATRMPGMLTGEEMARLATAKGSAFERLFLEYMIRHHEGALIMVAELFASPGAGQDSEIYRFASDVDTDQRAEIRRMRALLDAIVPPSGR